MYYLDQLQLDAAKGSIGKNSNAFGSNDKRERKSLIFAFDSRKGQGKHESHTVTSLLILKGMRKQFS